MPSCGCAGSSCSCQIVGGSGVTVGGVGTASNPYVIDAYATSVTSMIDVLDTPTIDLTRSGGGTVGDPYVISGVATVAMTDLTDVNDFPAAGEVPVWVDDGIADPHFEFQTPPTTPPGAVTVGAGLTGDGSGSAPLAVAVSGAWGTAPLDGFGTDSTLGQAIYVDVNGQVRTEPAGVDVVQSGGTAPDPYVGRVWVDATTNTPYYSPDGIGWQVMAPGRVTGEIVAFGGSTAPSGWFMCNGQELSRVDQANLFAVLGTAYGVGDGATTFNIPNLGGRVPMGSNGSYALGTSGGNANHTHNVTGTVAAHEHTLSNNGFAMMVVAATSYPNFYMRRVITQTWTANHHNGFDQGGAASTATHTLGASLGGTTDAATAAVTGTAASASSLPPYQVVNFIIKA